MMPWQTRMFKGLKIMDKILLFLVRLYSQMISPFTVRSCRFYPTCSCYAQDAIQAHGALKGSFLALKRICKCHPFHKGPAHDPVPN